MRARIHLLSTRIQRTAGQIQAWKEHVARLERSIDAAQHDMQRMRTEYQRATSLLATTVTDIIRQPTVAAPATIGQEIREERAQGVAQLGGWIGGACVCFDQGAHRAAMEDRYAALCDGDAWWYGVFDGHHGAATADVLERHLLPHVASQYDASAPIFAATHAFVSFDRHLYDEQQRHTHSTTGSTATVVRVARTSGDILVAWVGDTRAVLAVRRGSALAWRVERATHDHRLTSSPDEMKRCKQACGRVSDSGVYVTGAAADGYALSVTRAFGDFALKCSAVTGELVSPDGIISVRPHVERWQATDASVLIIASDGFWDAFPDDASANALISRELERCNGGAQGVVDVCRRLCDAALASLRCRDNVTLLMVPLVAW